MELLSRARSIAEKIKEEDEFLVVTHIDADGITSGAIAYESLVRIGKDVKILFLKQLDENSIEEIADENRFVWFTDLGSGYLSSILRKKIEFVVTDHHVPEMSYKWQLNPHDFGYDGSYELSGSTTTYLVSKFLGLNYDLSALAIVGAVGDLQDSRDAMLVGLNRKVLEEAVSCGYVRVVKDLRFFGKQTRPVYKMLEYTFDPYLPGISGKESGAIEFLASLGVRLKDGDWLRWIDLSREEKRRVVSGIVRVCIEAGHPYQVIKKIVGETYVLPKEEEGTELRDAMEFSTLLNATARYGFETVGLNVCLGDRGENLRKARNLLQNHRRTLSESIKFVEEVGIVELENVQFFHAKNVIPETIVGIVAGMSYSIASKNKPIVAFAFSDEGVKVSARATKSLVERGVHLASAIKEAAEAVGGSGGGHSIAAGAVIPRGKEDEFIHLLDKIIGLQLKS